MNPLLHRLPESPSNDEVLASIRAFAGLADEGGPHTWFYVLCWTFYRSLYDFLNDSPHTVIARDLQFTGEFAALAEAAHKAISEGSNAGLRQAANGIGKLVREIASLSKEKDR